MVHPWLGDGSPHRLLAPPWLAALDGVARSPSLRSGTVAARNADVRLTISLATDVHITAKRDHPLQ